MNCVVRGKLKNYFNYLIIGPLPLSLLDLQNLTNFHLVTFHQKVSILQQKYFHN